MDENGNALFANRRCDVAFLVHLVDRQTFRINWKVVFNIRGNGNGAAPVSHRGYNDL